MTVCEGMGAGFAYLLTRDEHVSKLIFQFYCTHKPVVVPIVQDFVTTRFKLELVVCRIQLGVWVIWPSTSPTTCLERPAPQGSGRRGGCGQTK